MLAPRHILREDLPRMLSDPSDKTARVLYDRAIEQYPKLADDLQARFSRDRLAFPERSMLLNVVTTIGVASIGSKAMGRPDADGLRQMRAKGVAATMELVASLRRTGKMVSFYEVGQGSVMMPLAVAYDWLYDDLDDAQRKQIMLAMIDYSIRPTLEALHKTRPFWIEILSNWTRINVGGAIACGLAARQADTVPFDAVGSDGKMAKRPFKEHVDSLLRSGLPNLARSFVLLQNNNGLCGEGPGYQHDGMLPLFAIAASLEGCLKDPQRAPAMILDFVAGAKKAGALHIHSGIHLASQLPGIGSLSQDWPYSDGTWGITFQPINLLIADYARQSGSSLWRQAAWVAAQRGDREELGMRLLYRSLFHWTAPQTDALGLADVDPKSIPTCHTFFNRRSEIERGEPGPNPMLVVWRQNWTDPNCSAVMFKGGDNRADRHSHLDGGTFVFDSMGVRWATDLGAAPYESWHKAGVRGANSRYYSYPSRACGHNTLVINPARNDYTQMKVAKTWLAEINPDQALDDGTSAAFGPVEGIRTDGPQCTGSVNLTELYARHGLLTRGAGADSRRTFTFNKATGELTVHDVLSFAQANNEVWWYMHVPKDVKPASQDVRRMILTTARPDGTQVSLELTLRDVVGNDIGGLKYTGIDENLPGRVSAAGLLWSGGSAQLHKDNFRKISVHLTGVGRSAQMTVTLRPMQVPAVGTVAAPSPPAASKNQPAPFVAAGVKKVGPAGDETEWRDALNLLPLIDLRQDIVSGGWTKQGNALIADALPFQRIEIPYEPPAEYDFRADFTAGGGAVVQFLSKPPRSFMWIMGGWRNTISAFDLVGGVTGDKNPTSVRQGGGLQNRRQYSSIIKVRNDSVKAYLDGKLVSQWKTDYSDMSIRAEWKLRKPSLLGVGAHGDRTVFHRIEVREITGKGRLTRGAAAPSATP